MLLCLDDVLPPWQVITATIAVAAAPRAAKEQLTNQPGIFFELSTLYFVMEVDLQFFILRRGAIRKKILRGAALQQILKHITEHSKHQGDARSSIKLARAAGSRSSRRSSART